MRVTDETKGDGWMDGRKDGTYSAGVKDSASAYVLCPRLTEKLCLSIWKGVGNTEKDLEDFERDESRKGMREDRTVGLTKLVYKLKLNY